MKTAAALLLRLPARWGAGEGMWGLGTNGSGPESASALLSGQERVLTTYCPLPAACAGPSSRGWLQAGLWSQVLCSSPSFAVYYSASRELISLLQFPCV